MRLLVDELLNFFELPLLSSLVEMTGDGGGGCIKPISLALIASRLSLLIVDEVLSRSLVELALADDGEGASKLVVPGFIKCMAGEMVLLSGWTRDSFELTLRNPRDSVLPSLPPSPRAQVRRFRLEMLLIFPAAAAMIFLPSLTLGALLEADDFDVAVLDAVDAEEVVCMGSNFEE